MAINKRIEGQHLRLARLQLPPMGGMSGSIWLPLSLRRLIFACFSPCGEAATTDRMRMKTRARIVKLSLYIVEGLLQVGRGERGDYEGENGARLRGVW